MLLSQFRVFGMDPTSIVLNTHAGNLNVSTGHYDQFAIQTVQAVSKAAGAGGNGAGASMDQANRLSAGGLGGTVYRFNVVCADSNRDHQSEVEFEVRFGLSAGEKPMKTIKPTPLVALLALCAPA